MGHVKDISNQPKQQTFPNSTFEIAADVPAAQCSEAKIEGGPPHASVMFLNLTHFGKFIGWNLAGKKVTVTDPAPDAGTYNITGNTDDWLITDHNFALPPRTVTYFCHNGGSLILTRNVQSFAQFIAAAGYTYTIKGGKLYTNIPSVDLQNACTILFAPLT